MYHTECYKYEKDGIIYVGGNVPDSAIILETMDILNADEGFELVRKSDGERVGNSIWLHDGDIQKNYKEEKIKEENL